MRGSRGDANQKPEAGGFFAEKPVDTPRRSPTFPPFPKAMKTTLAKNTDHAKGWYVIDAADQTLGRMCVTIANILRGRHKPTYTPHVDTGDFVVVVNAEKVRVTGRKRKDKQYMFYSGWMGNEKRVNFADMQSRHPKFIIEHAVKGMLPRNRLGRQMLKKLKVHTGPDHPYQAQQPRTLN